MTIPSPHNPFPLSDNLKRVCFLKNIIHSPNIEIGDYTYYDDWENVHNFEKNILYHFDFIGDRLIIGKLCQIAARTTFIMNDGNHFIESFSTYPFQIFGQEWGKSSLKMINKGNTHVGNDVWLGFQSVIMPGILIGDGAIIGAHSVVTKNVEPYSIVGANPAKEIRKRFDKSIIDNLLHIQWWNWPIEIITRNIEAILGADIGQLLTIDY